MESKGKGEFGNKERDEGSGTGQEGGRKQERRFPGATAARPELPLVATAEHWPLGCKAPGSAWKSGSRTGGEARLGAQAALQLFPHSPRISSHSLVPHTFLPSPSAPPPQPRTAASALGLVAWEPCARPRRAGSDGIARRPSRRRKRHGGGAGGRRADGRAGGAARVAAERLPLRHRSERLPQEPAGQPGAVRRWSLGRPKPDGHRPDGPAARPVAAERNSAAKEKSSPSPHTRTRDVFS